MQIKVRRYYCTGTATLGQLFIDGKLFCYTVEDVVRKLDDKNNDGDFNDAGEGKVYGRTAIPAGTYDVITTYSPKYKRMMPLIKDVPGFSGIRIHSGNTHKDTEGCLILGMMQTTYGVAQSRVACKKFDEIIKGQTNIKITIGDYEH